MFLNIAFMKHYISSEKKGWEGKLFTEERETYQM